MGERLRATETVNDEATRVGFGDSVLHEALNAVFDVRLKLAHDVGRDAVVECEVRTQTVEICCGFRKHPVSFARRRTTSPTAR